MTRPETQSLLMPSGQVANTEHVITHKSLPCPDELSDTAAFCEHFNVALAKAANTMLVTSRKVELAVQAVCVVFGTMGMPIYVDSAVLEQDEVVMGGGNRTSKLLLNPRELRKLPGVELWILDDGDSQVILSTHSPILASLPGAAIYEVGDWGLLRNDWEDLELVRNWRSFMDAPQRFLKYI